MLITMEIGILNIGSHPTGDPEPYILTEDGFILTDEDDNPIIAEE